MKKVTKKSIEEAVRSNNRTALFAMFKGDRSAVYKAISDLQIKKLSKMAYDLAYAGQHKYNRVLIPSKEIYSDMVQAIMYARGQVASGRIQGNYGKILFEGNQNIYWASPTYGHGDYNKSRAFKNNESNRLVAQKINLYLKSSVVS